MIVLGLNMSEKLTQASLVQDGRILGSFSIDAKQRIAEDLPEELEQWLKRLNLSFKDLSALGVVVGPGNYTGLRLSITTAKTIAQIMSIPLYGYDSFEVLFDPIKRLNQTSLVILPARKNELNIKVLGANAGKVKAISTPFILTHNAFLEHLNTYETSITVCGSAANFDVKTFKEIMKNSHVRWYESQTDSTIVATLAYKDLLHKKKGDYTKVNPHYSYSAV